MRLAYITKILRAEPYVVIRGSREPAMPIRIVRPFVRRDVPPALCHPGSLEPGFPVVLRRMIKYGRYEGKTMVLPEYVLIFCTAPAQEAEILAKSLIDAHLAACVNIADVRSFYRWEGKVHDEPERLLIVKTQYNLLDPLIARIKALHSYDTPEIIAIPIVGGYAPYLEWIREETA